MHVKILRDAILIGAIAAAVGLAVNGIRSYAALGGLPLDTPWPDNRQRVELEFPPSYEEGDSLLTVEDAYGLYLDGKALFLDARDPVEYEEGHIKGAVNLPFDWWDEYWEDVKPLLNSDQEIIAYCGGFDCELSVFLTRDLKYRGYVKSYIFFGGWLKWIEAGLPVENSKSDND
jgi:rhodanese-related sulfurtransferase